MTDSEDVNNDTDAMTAYRTGRSDGLKESKDAAFWKGFALGILVASIIFWTTLFLFSALNSWL